jgi:hypothetical protein
MLCCLLCSVGYAGVLCEHRCSVGFADVLCEHRGIFCTCHSLIPSRVKCDAEEYADVPFRPMFFLVVLDICRSLDHGWLWTLCSCLL